MIKVADKIVEDYYRPDDGELHMISGGIKQGKSLTATKMAWDDLMRGQTVAANWRINWKGYDERKDWRKLFLGFIGLKRVFSNIPADNFIYLDPGDSHMMDRVSLMTDIIIYLDEGHLYLDSYKKTSMSLEDRNAINFTAHFNRTIKVISQRDTAIHASMRDNVHRFFRVEKVNWLFGLFARFHVTEVQDMIGGVPDWTKPVDVKSFWGSKQLYKLYDYKSMRGGMPRSQPNFAKMYTMKYNDIKLAWKNRRKQDYNMLSIEDSRSLIISTPPLPPVMREGSG